MTALPATRSIHRGWNWSVAELEVPEHPQRCRAASWIATTAQPPGRLSLSGRELNGRGPDHEALGVRVFEPHVDLGAAIRGLRMRDEPLQREREVGLHRLAIGGADPGELTAA